MRAHLAAAAVALLAALGGAVNAEASHSPGGAPTGEDFAVGSASIKQFSLDCCFVEVDAHSGPTGAAPTGTARMFERAFDNGGPVTCLNVTGNRAIIGGSGGTGPGYLFKLVDNAATGVPDQFSGPPSFFPGPHPTCPSDLDVPLRGVTSGDLVVHDATPPPALPTHVRHCLAGGWRTFGFPSLGRCVVFVALTRICKVLERHGSQPGFCPPGPPRG